MASLTNHLVDLACVRAEDLHDVIVSRQGDTIVSRYGDDVWSLVQYLAPRNRPQVRIRFSHPFKGGCRLTDPKYESLLASVKRFLYTRWCVAGGQRGRPVSASTVQASWSQIRKLLAWMVDENLMTFSELTPNHCARFAASLTGELQATAAADVLGTITSYYELGDHLVDRIPEYPWQPDCGGPANLARRGRQPRLQSWKQATTEVIPQRLMSKLVRTALDYVENRSDSLLSLRDQLAVHATRRLAEVKRVHRKTHPDGFSSVFADEETYIRMKASHRCSREERQLLAEHRYARRRQVEIDLFQLRTACYIVCAAFSGMRVSELASLEVGCFVKRTGFDGDTFCWLQGMTYKLEHEPKPAEWMVPEVVGKAVSVATRLGEPERALADERIKFLERTAKARHLDEQSRAKIEVELERIRRSRNALLLTHTRLGMVSVVGRDSIRGALSAFSRMAGLRVEQQDMDGVVKRDRIRLGETWPLTPHEFRRTFAVYVARHVLGDIRYLREHFKHWSLDMTLYYARHDTGADRTLINDIMTERDELQSLIIQSWMNPHSSLSGVGGRRIMAFRSRGELKTVRDMRDFCRKLGESVFIRGTGHSWCMASGDGCGGQGLYDAVRCTSCGEAVIDSTHVEIWKGIRQQQIDVLGCPDLGIPSRQRCLDHLRKAERVLADLGAETSPSLSSAKVHGGC
ncbi:tyrosine-type recombinase/integrase [Paraburkholderia lacunae]|uniref:Integrase n=1 Tax=Paraburkholderia lacunae TaxID=2211104 RepID=A0A370MYN7_9BURK|nr:tyrosine-type recombinase/integrase [Paraburkholderia lacunae]RDJ98469.1 integrase [Paraburkholderia lacunae]